MLRLAAERPQAKCHLAASQFASPPRVRHIFEMAASGTSLRKIAKTLNREKIAPPRRPKKENPSWCPTAIHAMLRREMYSGRVIWNRSRFVKSPGTNKRMSRPRPRSEWRVIERPELRIVCGELWERVQTQLAWKKKIRSADTQRIAELISLKPVSVQRYREMCRLRRESGNHVGAEPPRSSKIRVFAALLSRNMLKWPPNQKGLVRSEIVRGAATGRAPTGSRQLRCCGVLPPAQGSRRKCVA